MLKIVSFDNRRPTNYHDKWRDLHIMRGMMYISDSWYSYCSNNGNLATPINFTIVDLKTIVTNGEIYKQYLSKKKKKELQTIWEKKCTYPMYEIIIAKHWWVNHWQLYIKSKVLTGPPWPEKKIIIIMYKF